MTITKGFIIANTMFPLIRFNIQDSFNPELMDESECKQKFYNKIKLNVFNFVSIHLNALLLYFSKSAYLIEQSFYDRCSI